MNRIQVKYSNVFNSKCYESVRYVAFKFTKTPNILFSGGTQGLYDFQGNFLQKIESNNLEMIFVNGVSTNDGGIVVFQWFEGESVNQKFIDSLIKCQSNMVNTIIKFIFVSFENMFINIKWWDNLDHDLKNDLIKYVPVRHDENLLSRNNKHYDDWGEIIIHKDD